MGELLSNLGKYGKMNGLIWLFIFYYAMLIFNQILHYLSRPKDYDRLRYMVLLFLFVVYNLITCYLPDIRIRFNYNLQVIIAFFIPIVLAYYVSFYIYTLLRIKELEIVLVKAPFFTLILPYFLMFLVPYIFMTNIGLSKRLLAVVPSLYAFFAIYKVNSVLVTNHKKDKDIVTHFYPKIVVVNISIVSFIFLAAAQFIESQFLGLISINAGLILMSIIFMIIIIKDSLLENERLIKSEQKIQKLNLQLEQKVLERTKELEDFIEQRTSTFISLAHETRTPITLIKNKLEEYAVKKPHSNEIDSIKLYVDKLNKQISNILDIEKTIKGNMVYEHDTVINISELLKDRIAIFQSYGSKKEIQLIHKIEDDIYLKVSMDAIDSLINNLIENAIKFTDPKGSITITLKASKDSILYSVKDTGTGIHEKLHQKIFTPYYRIPSKANGNHSIGIGLYIVKNIVKSLKGEITLNSRPNEGSEFMVKLPQHVVDLQNVFEPYKHNLKGLELGFHDEIEDGAIDLSKPGILIVEDNLDLLTYLKSSLIDKYNVYVATNGTEAMNKLDKIDNDPDLILSDVMMDKMDGFVFFQKLQKSEFNYIPVIYITAKANSVDRDKALEMGAIDYIYKPFDIKEVREKVGSVVNNSRKQRGMAIKSVKGLLENEFDNIINNAGVQSVDFDSKCLSYNISSREKEIIKLAYEGKSYNDIAEKLCISPKTVDNHFQKIFRKVGVNRQQDLLNTLNH